MSAHEVILVLLASGILYIVLALRERRWVGNALLVLCLVPALFLAVEGATEILTADETYMIREITDFNKLSARQWNLENYHTSIALIGSIVNAVNRLFRMSDLQANVLAKAVHWLLGVVCLVGIFSTTTRRWIPKNLLAEYFVVFFYSGLLLPTNILSLKVVNYDMLSMFLGIWGMISGFVGCANVKTLLPKQSAETGRWWSIFSETLCPDGGFTLLGIVLATLAAQEKPIAGPFLTFALVLSGLMRIRRRGRIDWWLPVQVAIGLLVTGLVVLLTYGVVDLWHPPDLPAFNLAVAWRFLFPHLDIVLHAIGISEPGLLTHTGVVIISAALTPMLIWWLRFAKDGVAAVIRVTFPLLLIISLIVGAISSSKLQAYLHPVFPIPDGNFVPPAEPNGEIVHYLSRTRLEHILKKAAHAYSVYPASLPTAFVLVAGIVVGSLLWRKRLELNGFFSGFEAIGILASGMPLIYVLTDLPLGIRYFNIWIFTQVLLLIILGCDLLELLPRRRLRALIVAAFCVSLLLELLPFRPNAGAFWSYWGSASLPRMAEPIEPGKLVPMWPGWGEEAMIAGRRLRKMALAAQLPSSSFRLYVICRGDWLTSDQTIKTYWVPTAPYLSFTENDYYVVNRAVAVKGTYRSFTDAKPISTIEYRGVPQAWIYRGSDLKPNF
jgi:hypothetical protein